MVTDNVRKRMSDVRKTHQEATKIVRVLGTEVGISDPYPYYLRLRELSPIHFSEFGSVMLTRYAECLAVLRDPAFPSDDFDLRDKYMPNWREHSALRTFGSSLIFRNPPIHTRLRRQVSRLFAPGRVELFGHQVECLIDEHLASIDVHRMNDGSHDFYRVARDLAMAVIASFVGAPKEDWRWLIGPAIGMTALINLNTTLADFEIADRAADDLVPYLRQLIEDRRRNPQEDLISSLAAGAVVGDADDESEALSEDELLQMLVLLLAAGVQPTLSLLTNGLAALFRFPEQALEFRADHGLARGLVEEILRYDTPIQTVGRITGQHARINGMKLPADMEVTAVIGAANRDPARFPDPDTFLIRRTDRARVASFGNGFHACIGQYLARTVGYAAFPKLYSAFPELGPAGEPVRLQNMKIRGYRQFPVFLGSRAC
jgi:cytochrome P450